MTPDSGAQRVAFRGRIDEDTYVRAQDLAVRASGLKGTTVSTLCLVAGAFFLLLALAASGDGAFSWFFLSAGAFGAAWRPAPGVYWLWPEPCSTALARWSREAP